jgi:16S rRNA (uracil1498-N3)-methyltransferase
MHRFFVSVENIVNTELNFPKEISHQISRVLRLKSGQEVMALDNLGSEYLVELTNVEGSHVSGVILNKQPAGGEPQVRLYLYLCLSQREKFELMLQKCTEIGAAGFIPVISSRSLVQGLEERGNKINRWEKIIQEAAEQSGRGRIPVLKPAQKFSSAVLQALKTHARVLLPSPLQSDEDGIETVGRGEIKQVLNGLTRADQPEIGVFIGPEGGFSEEEIALAKASGCIPVDLGKRILRMETAAITAAALILYEFGEMG